MPGLRRAIELAIGEEDLAKLVSMTRSRTAPASRVERARMLLAYREDPSFFAVGRALGVHHQTVQRCVERALAYGPMAALDDRARPGKEPTITAEAKAWVVNLACRKAKDLGYPHELWTTRLLARHVREQGPAEGHACLAKLAQGTVCKILNEQEIKPHKVRYYLERRDPEFKQKMAEVLCVYREVKLIKEAAAAKREPSDAVAIVSYDEKPGIQAIATTAPDLPPEPGRHATLARDYEYKRHGTVSLLAGIEPAHRLLHHIVLAGGRSSSGPCDKTPCLKTFWRNEPNCGPFFGVGDIAEPAMEVMRARRARQALLDVALRSQALGPASSPTVKQYEAKRTGEAALRSPRSGTGSATGASARERRVDLRLI